MTALYKREGAANLNGATPERAAYDPERVESALWLVALALASVSLVVLCALLGWVSGR